MKDYDPVFIMAEVGQAHDGSLGILHSFIDALAHTGVDAVKFQTHIADAESSAKEPFRINFSYEDSTRYDYWKRMEFTFEQWREIKHHCEKFDLEFVSSPFSMAAIDLLESVGVKRYKVGSGEVTNLLMIERLAKIGKPVILSSGMSSFVELEEAVSILTNHRCEYYILQCTTSYPTTAENIGLNVIPELEGKFQCQVGLSDHSGTIYPSLAAVALGATLLEFHCTWDRRMYGPDAKSSLTIDEITELVKGVRFLEQTLRNPVDKTDIRSFKELKFIFEKSLAVNKDLPIGHQLRFEDLECKKPASQGIPARQYKEVLGRGLKRALKKFSFLTENDLE